MTREELEQRARDVIARSVRMSGTWTVADHEHALEKITALLVEVHNAAVEECMGKVCTCSTCLAHLKVKP